MDKNIFGAGRIPSWIATLLFSWLYSKVFLHYTSIDEWERPYITRAFIPLLQRLLSLLIDGRAAFVIVLIGCAFGFVLALYYLWGSFYPMGRRADMYVIVNILLLFLIVSDPRFRQKYDLATAFLFTLEIALLARRRLFEYLLILPFAVLNRETSFLLILLFAVEWRDLIRDHLWRYGLLVGFQASILISIRMIIMIVYADAPGVTLVFRPIENLRMYLDAPLQAGLFLYFLGSILFWVIVRWDQTPSIIRRAFTIFASILFVMYVFFGQSFEFRVFIEILPIITLFFIYPKEASHEK